MIDHTVRLFEDLSNCGLVRRGLYGQDVWLAEILVTAFLAGVVLFLLGCAIKRGRLAGVAGLMGVLLIVVSIGVFLLYDAMAPKGPEYPERPASISEPASLGRLAGVIVIFGMGLAFFKVVGIL